MHFYPHNIPDFNNATRHLTRVERSVYRDSIDLYYDTEQPLPADDVLQLARKLLCHSDEEKHALSAILGEFYTLIDGEYRHIRCDEEIAKYRANNTAKARAGKASAESRRIRKRTATKQKLTGVEQTLNTRSTEDQHAYITNNQELITNNKELIGSKTLGDSHDPNDLFTEFWTQYPRHDGRDAALRAFKKHKPDRQFTDRLLGDIALRLGTGTWTEKQFIPHASTYLNGRRWEDELTPSTPITRDDRNILVATQWRDNNP